MYFIIRSFGTQILEITHGFDSFNDASAKLDEIKRKVTLDHEHYIGVSSINKTKWYVVNCPLCLSLDGSKLEEGIKRSL